MASKQSPRLESLETSKMWKQSVKLAEHARQVAEVFPHHEQYTLATPLVQNAVLVTSDIAFALGKGGTEGDYRYARGHVFTVKSLLLMAQHYEAIVDIHVILNEANSLLNMIDTKIRDLETKAKKDS